MSKNTGKELEKLVGRVYELLNTGDSNIAVEVDVLIESPDGARQFDVVITAQLGESSLLTVVEVRDWKKRLSISHVDGFVSKMQDVDADKGILVSRYGFQKSAIRKAKRMHLDICTAHHLENLKDFRVQFPVVVHYLRFTHQRVTFSARKIVFSHGEPDIMNFYLNDRPILEVFREELMTGIITPNVRRPLNDGELELIEKMEVGKQIIDLDSLEGPTNKWTASDSEKLTYKDKVTGMAHAVGEVNIAYGMSYEYYFGYLAELPGSFGLDNISKSEAVIFYNPEMVRDFETKFTKFSSMDEIPVNDAVNLHFLEYTHYEKIANLQKP